MKHSQRKSQTVPCSSCARPPASLCYPLNIFSTPKTHQYILKTKPAVIWTPSSRKRKKLYKVKIKKNNNDCLRSTGQSCKGTAASAAPQPRCAPAPEALRSDGPDTMPLDHSRNTKALEFSWFYAPGRPGCSSSLLHLEG